MLSFCQVHVIY